MNENKKEFLEYLRSVYGHCHTHLLEQGRKRDQVLTFYVVLLSFVLTNLDKLEKEFLGRFTVLIVYVILILVGWIILNSLSDLRSWHTQYLGAIYVLNWVFANENKYQSVDALVNTINKLMTKKINDNKRHVKRSDNLLKKIKVFLHNYLFSSTDNSIYTGVVLLTALPVWGICGYFKLSILWSIFIFLTYFVGAIHYFERKLQEKLQKAEVYDTWILSFDYNGRLEKRWRYEMGK